MMIACRILAVACAGLAGWPLLAADRIDAPSVLKLLQLDDTVAIDLVAVEPGTAMHPQALRWAQLYADHSLADDLPPSLQRVVLLGEAEASTVSQVEQELARTIHQQLPVFHYSGPAGALASAPATAIAGHKQRPSEPGEATEDHEHRPQIQR